MMIGLVAGIPTHLSSGKKISKPHSIESWLIYVDLISLTRCPLLSLLDLYNPQNIG